MEDRYDQNVHPLVLYSGSKIMRIFSCCSESVIWKIQSKLKHHFHLIYNLQFVVKDFATLYRNTYITDGTTMNNVSVVLPPGTYRIMIEATAASVVASYIALTNVNVEPGRCPGTNNSCSENQFT